MLKMSRGAGRVTARERHLAAGVDDRAGVEARDVDMLDGLESSSAFRLESILASAIGASSKRRRRMAIRLAASGRKTGFHFS
jgi:hypothetical protein